MRKLLCLCATLGVFLASSVATAQEPERAFCDDANPDNNCPGDDCLCVDDTIEIVFEGQLENSVWEYETFDADAIIPGRILIDVKSDQIRGFSFGVAHNTAEINPLLGAEGLNIGPEEGVDPALAPDTASLPARMGGFVALRLIVSGGERKGFILAIVLNFSAPAVLPLGRQTVANCNYKLETDVGTAGTLLSFTEDLGDPPTQVVLTVDELEFPEMVDKDEGNCIDGLDGDFDGLIDRDDPDCVVRNGVSRVPRILVEGLVKMVGGAVDEICDNEIDDDGDGDVDCDDADCEGDPACPVVDPEICDNEIDDDGDGNVDCDDSDCAGDPACPVVDPEICDNEIDDDGDGNVDCDDSDCAGDPACPVVDPEICDNEIDDDGDGDVDCDDSDCEGDPACPSDCPDYAFYFGDTATDAVATPEEDGTLAVSMRNALPSTGFQLGAKATVAGDEATWEFSSDLGGTADTLVELLIADNASPLPTAHDPEAGNTATTPDEPVTVALGAAVAAFPEGSDLLLVDFISEGNGVGGTGFTVGYVSDINNDGTDNVIAATTGDGCTLNEILVVSVGGAVAFSRGDADGNSKINVLDAVIIIQLVIGNIMSADAPFACDDIYDANDNGELDLGDGVMPLQYAFARGPALADPFRTCGEDGTDDDTLVCTESNCQ